MVNYIPTEENVADIFTKALHRPKFDWEVGAERWRGEGRKNNKTLRRFPSKLHQYQLFKHAPSMINMTWWSCDDVPQAYKIWLCFAQGGVLRPLSSPLFPLFNIYLPITLVTSVTQSHLLWPSHVVTTCLNFLNKLRCEFNNLFILYIITN